MLSSIFTICMLPSPHLATLGHHKMRTGDITALGVSHAKQRQNLQQQRHGNVARREGKALGIGIGDISPAPTAYPHLRDTARQPTITHHPCLHLSADPATCTRHAYGLLSHVNIQPATQPFSQPPSQPTAMQPPRWADTQPCSHPATPLPARLPTRPPTHPLA